MFIGRNSPGNCAVVEKVYGHIRTATALVRSDRMLYKKWLNYSPIHKVMCVCLWVFSFYYWDKRKKNTKVKRGTERKSKPHFQQHQQQKYVYQLFEKIFDTVRVMGQILWDLFSFSSWNSYKQLHCNLVQRFIALDVCRCGIVFVDIVAAAVAVVYVCVFFGGCNVRGHYNCTVVAFREQCLWWWLPDTIAAIYSMNIVQSALQFGMQLRRVLLVTFKALIYTTC